MGATPQQPPDNDRGWVGRDKALEILAAEGIDPARAVEMLEYARTEWRARERAKERNVEVSCPVRSAYGPGSLDAQGDLIAPPATEWYEIRIT